MNHIWIAQFIMYMGAAAWMDHYGIPFYAKIGITTVIIIATLLNK